MSAIGSVVSRIAGVLLWLPGWAIALIVGLGGALNAWGVYIQKAGPLPATIQLVFLFVMAVLFGHAKYGALPKQPVLAAREMDGLVIGLVIAGALGVFVGVMIAIAFTLPEKPAPTPEMTEVSKAISAAIAAAVTAAIVKVAQDDPDGAVASLVRGAFVETYKGEIGTYPDLRGALYNDGDEGITGWGRSARLDRAEKIAEIRAVPPTPPATPPASSNPTTG